MESAIKDYVDALGRALDGPGRPKRDLVTEARDSLVDAAEAIREAGVPRREAERLAVADFGPVADIAPGYQRELAACAGRRLGVLVFLGVPALALMWWLLWRLFPAGPAIAAVAPSWFFAVSWALDAVHVVVGAAGGMALLALGRGRRRIREPRGVVLALAGVVWVALLATFLLSTALMYGSQWGADFSAYPPGMVVTVVSLLVWSAQAYAATRCLRAARPAPPAR